MGGKGTEQASMAQDGETRSVQGWSCVRRTAHYTQRKFADKAAIKPVGSETGRDVEVHYSEADGSLSSKVEDVGDFTKRTMNVAFAGKPAQCIVSHVHCRSDAMPDKCWITGKRRNLRCYVLDLQFHRANGTCRAESTQIHF